MKVLVTGHDGYIGSVFTPMARASGHDVTGLDAFWFEGCALGPEPEAVRALRLDVRDTEVEHLRGFDAVVHLAAISNDPLGHLDPDRTYEINHLGSVRIAKLAKRAGVERFIFASSCSLYGAASPDDLLTEAAAFNPVTPYGESKVLAEQDLSALADDGFSPILLRNATVYGYSPRLRLDLVVNDLVANAFASGEVVIKSDGTPWRPLVHVEDVAQAALAAIEAPRETVHNQAFNVGVTTENYQVRDIADIVTGGRSGKSCDIPKRAEVRTHAAIALTFPRQRRASPGSGPRWTVSDGVRELLLAFREHRLTLEDLGSARFVRLRRIQELQEGARVGQDLRWIPTLQSR